MSRPAKPPRSVWVFFGHSGHPLSTMLNKINGWTRYDLHRPKRKPAKRRRGK